MRRVVHTPHRFAVLFTQDHVDKTPGMESGVQKAFIPCHFLSPSSLIVAIAPRATLGVPLSPSLDIKTCPLSSLCLAVPETRTQKVEHKNVLKYLKSHGVFHSSKTRVPDTSGMTRGKLLPLFSTTSPTLGLSHNTCFTNCDT